MTMTLSTTINTSQHSHTIKHICLFKFKALMFHLLVSASLLLLSWLLIAYIWYPEIHFWINGGWEGMKLMFAVDFVLGPIITLVIFHPKKKLKWLLFDISIVATIQLSALMYGLIQIYNESIEALVFVNDEFRIVQHAPLKSVGYDDSIFTTFDTVNHPPLLVSQYDKENKNNSDQLDIFLSTGLLDEYYVMQYQPMSKHLDSITTSEKTQQFLEQHPKTLSVLVESLQRRKLMQQDVRIIPLKGKYQDAFIILDQQGRFLNYLEIQEQPKLIPY